MDTIQLKEIISSLFILTGVFFMIVATIGLLRLPDFYIRMSAITKGATLGVGMILFGLAVYFNQPSMLVKILSIILFIFITAPVAAHVIARTAVQNKIPFWDRTNLTEFRSYLHQEHLDGMESQDKYKEDLLKAKRKNGEHVSGKE